MFGMKKYKDDNESEPLSFWESYSDLMSALLLMFVLVMASLLLNSLSIYQEKIEKETKARILLEEQAENQKKLQEELEEQKKLLEIQQEQLEKMIGLKERIIKGLASDFEKTDLTVAVDANTGSIAFDSSILFKSDSYDLTDSGKEFLSEFVPVYFDAILSSEYSDYISEIIIEGHTDIQGNYMYNLELSQKRALSVSQYCLEKIAADNRFDIEKIRKIVTANGRSWSNPVYNEDYSINMDASRRVEFKFRLKDDEMIDQMKGILENG